MNLEDVIEALTDLKTKRAAQEQAEKAPEQSEEIQEAPAKAEKGATQEKPEVEVSDSPSSDQDEVIAELKNEIKTLKAKIKAETRKGGETKTKFSSYL